MEWEELLERLVAILHDLKTRKAKADVLILLRPDRRPAWSVRWREHERTKGYGVIE